MCCSKSITLLTEFQSQYRFVAKVCVWRIASYSCLSLLYAAKLSPCDSFFSFVCLILCLTHRRHWWKTLNSKDNNVCLFVFFCCTCYFFLSFKLFIFRISCIKWTKFDLFGVLCRWAVEISERTVTYNIHVARTLNSSASLFQGSIYIALHFGIYTVSKSCWMKYHYSLEPLWLFA